MGNQERQPMGVNNYAPASQANNVRLATSYAVQRGWVQEVADISNAFLQTELPPTDQLYFIPPQGYDTKPGMVLKLKKNIYGLFRTPRLWWLDF